ncbi:MAG: hypothetical protein HKN50_01225 [Gammaproteobacteria bacterium]|nr:hypothetical protein [Gammaproteobacteria bacterium]
MSRQLEIDFTGMNYAQANSARDLLTPSPDFQARVRQDADQSSKKADVARSHMSSTLGDSAASHKPA